MLLFAVFLAGCASLDEKTPSPKKKEPVFANKQASDAYLKQVVRLNAVSKRLMENIGEGLPSAQEEINVPPFFYVRNTEHLNRFYGKSEVSGILVAGLLDADKAPLSDVQAGDELIAVNGQDVRTEPALIKVMAETLSNEANFRFKRGEYEWSEFMTLDRGYRLPVFAVDPKASKPNGWTNGVDLIVLNLAMLKLAGNDDELAFILAHEIAHIQLKHYDGRQKIQLGEAVIAGTVSVFVTNVLSAQYGPAYSGQYVSRQAGSVAGQFAGKAAMSPFSKSQESGADKHGLRLLSNAGFDSARAIMILTKFDNDGFSFTHPDSMKRYEELRALTTA